MRVAVIQMECDDSGGTENNIEVMSKLIDEECIKSKDTTKPELFLGPEFAICGYTYDSELAWSLAEREGGRTETFLCEMAKKHEIFFGLSYLEAREVDGKPHFQNTFALAGPSGIIEGRVRKSRPCSVESCIFRGSGEGDKGHVIQCSNGYRVGVLICYENVLCDAIQDVQTEGCDILLQPFSGPLSGGGGEEFEKALQELYSGMCTNNSKLVGAPALYCNKVGKWKSPSPTYLAPSTAFDTKFPGESKICDENGNVICQLNETDIGVLTADVNVVASRKEYSKPDIPRYSGGYTNSAFFLKICIIFEWLGKRSYNNNHTREEMGRKILE